MTTARTTFRRLAALGAASALGIAGFSAAPATPRLPVIWAMTAATCVKTGVRCPRPTRRWSSARRPACVPVSTRATTGSSSTSTAGHPDTASAMSTRSSRWAWRRRPGPWGARLQIDINAPAYDADGTLVYTPANPREAVDASAIARCARSAGSGRSRLQ